MSEESRYHSEIRNTNNLVRGNNNTNDIWLKPQNPKSRARRFSANVTSHIRLSNKFGVLEVYQQNRGSLKHKDMKIKSLTGKSNSQKTKILLLGSSHGRNIGPLLQNHLGTEYEVTSIFKPNAPLENIVEGLQNLGKDLTKKETLLKKTILLQWVGQKTAWKEIIITLLKRTSISLLGGQITPTSDL